MFQVPGLNPGRAARTVSATQNKPYHDRQKIRSIEDCLCFDSTVSSSQTIEPDVAGRWCTSSRVVTFFRNIYSGTVASCSVCAIPNSQLGYELEYQKSLDL
jgi:hypothetical protein